MTEEEKKALEEFMKEYESCNHHGSDLVIEFETAEIIVELIQKQQKELE